MSPHLPADHRQDRADALKTAAVASASLAAGGLLAAALPLALASSPSNARDRALDLLLLVELQQESFYAAAAEVAHEEGGELEEFVYTAHDHERTHLRLVRQLRGSRPEPRASFDFGDDVKSRESVLSAAQALEDLNVATYNGQLANLDRASRQLTGRIAATEARHATWAGRLSGDMSFTTTTDPAFGEAQTRAEIERLGYLQEG
ncbi:MAG: ferritin-like domain-containing protein [Thermoleophilia bacterium]|nr:ferritin-like domain-containing protein [Thermoleophilia bacterium]MDH3725350.1 ferritin-like domain-containing protein [Thermoleophilia bacterium]